MSEFSHKNKLKQIKKDHSISSSHNYQNDFHGNQSIMSYNSARSSNDILSSQPSFLSGEISIKNKDRDLQSNFTNSAHVIGVAPSVRSLKSNMPMRSRSLNASKASLSSKRSNIQQEAHDIQLQRKIRKPWYGVGRYPFRIAILFYILSLTFLTTGLTLIILTSFGNIFLPMDTGQILGPSVVVLAIICLAVGIKLHYKSYSISEKSRSRLKFRGLDRKMVSMTTKLPESNTRDTLVSGTHSEMAVTKKYQQFSH